MMRGTSLRLLWESQVEWRIRLVVKKYWMIGSAGFRFLLVYSGPRLRCSSLHCCRVGIWLSSLALNEAQMKAGSKSAKIDFGWTAVSWARRPVASPISVDEWLASLQFVTSCFSTSTIHWADFLTSLWRSNFLRAPTIPFRLAGPQFVSPYLPFQTPAPTRHNPGSA